MKKIISFLFAGWLVAFCGVAFAAGGAGTGETLYTIEYTDCGEGITYEGDLKVDLESGEMSGEMDATYSAESGNYSNPDTLEMVWANCDYYAKYVVSAQLDPETKAFSGDVASSARALGTGENPFVCDYWVSQGEMSVDPGKISGSFSDDFDRADATFDKDIEGRSSCPISFIKKEEWKADIKNCYEAYAIVDGKEIKIDNSFSVGEGVTIMTKYKESEALIELSDGSTVFLSGEGSKATIYPENNGNFVLMGPGTMTVKYETGGKSGEWKSGSSDTKVSGTDEPLDMMYVLFSASASGEFSFPEGAIGTVAGLRDIGHRSAPLGEVAGGEDSQGGSGGNGSGSGGSGGFWGLLFGNRSVVEYNYDGENATVKVYEGEVDVMKINFESGEFEKVESVLPGESFWVDLSEFFKAGSGGVGGGGGALGSFVKSKFSLKEKSQQIEKLMEKSFVKDNWVVIAGVVVFVFGIGIFFIVKRK